MNRFLCVLLLLTPACAFASHKDTADYVDGVLVSFHDIRTGNFCSSSGDVNGRVNDDGSVSGTTSGSTNCTDGFARLYTVEIGGQTMTLKRAFSGHTVATAALTMGWSALFIHQSVLANKLPGTHFEAINDGSHIRVRIGKKETIFDIVEATTPSNVSNVATR